MSSTRWNLSGQAFTAVGYGIIRLNKERGPNGFIDNLPDNVRWVAPGRFRSVQAYLLTLSQNAATGDGGTCYGDSGGPHFLGGTAINVAITVLGDRACQALSRTYRLDTGQARAFIASQGVALP